MKVFVTGATGFVGSHLVPELIGAGHEVVGLSRSDRGADMLRRAGAEVFRGDVNDLDRLRLGAAGADGIIHAAFDHGADDLQANSEDDRRVVAALGSVVAGSERPLVVSSGTGLARSEGRVAMETDGHFTSAEFPRAATEEAAHALVEAGARVIVLRLSQVHDTRHHGRISRHIQLARTHRAVAYVGRGTNRLPAVHVTDAVHLYRLALEHGRSGARYHAVAEEGVALCDIAEVIGANLGLPVTSITADAAREYFGPMAELTTLDLAASSDLTRQELGWEPTGPDLLTDLKHMDHEGID